jgi:recA bacterial DNA recombination protein
LRGDIMGLLESRFREKMAKLKDPKMDEGSFDVLYPTGFLPFDYANGYIVNGKTHDGREFFYNAIGIVDGSSNMVIGRTGSGKTTFAIQAGANIIKPFQDAVMFYDDIEGGSNEVRREILTQFSPLEIKKRVIYRNSAISAENFYKRIQELYDEKLSHRDDYEYNTGKLDSGGNEIYKLTPTVYVLDSLAMLTPDKITDEEELSGQMSTTATAKVNTSVFKRIIPKLKAANIILFVINHINQKVEINPFSRSKSQIAWLKPDETIPGGNASQYVANNIIRIDDNTKLKDSDGLGVAGKIVDFSMVKSRSNRPGNPVSMLFRYDIGYDPILSLYVFLKSIGAIESKGAYMNLINSDIKFTQKTFMEKLYSDSKFTEVFNDVCKHNLEKLLGTINIVENERISEFQKSIINSIIGG